MERDRRVEDRKQRLDKSRLLAARGSQPVDLSQWISASGPRVVDLGSWISGRGSQPVDLGSWTSGRGPRVVDLGSIELQIEVDSYWTASTSCPPEQPLLSWW
ncbi:hypothetical protein EYF80_012114 [Liparis tanakae]|uniref:Uncharacterized protein n=1 Tax=Liparis tanakae TaxID=230148 RepID=A0A4Z2IJ90_9TELE|nr:hypothetical protein EYF80_012114 [Liparis tanakae]